MWRFGISVTEPHSGIQSNYTVGGEGLYHPSTSEMPIFGTSAQFLDELSVRAPKTCQTDCPLIHLRDPFEITAMTEASMLYRISCTSNTRFGNIS